MEGGGEARRTGDGDEGDEEDDARGETH